MVRLTSIQQTLSLRGTTPEIVIIRSLQFMGNGYNPEVQEHIIIQISHNDFSRTQRYAHMADDSLQTATDNMAGVIDRAVGG